MRLLVIENPAAGRGSARRDVSRLVGALEARGHSVLHRATAQPGDAARCAAEAEGRVDCIVTAGGDGTLNEALNGLADPAGTPLTSLAAGTANMLADAIGLPRDPERLAAAIESGRDLCVDLCSAGSRRFLLVASAGFDAAVTQMIASGRKGRLGYRGYVRPVLRALRRYRPPALRVRLDGGSQTACAFVILSKLDNYGGVFRLGCGTQLDSGRLQVMLMSRARLSDLVRYAATGLHGVLADRAAVQSLQATRIEIEAAEPTPVQVDGEFWGLTPVSIALEPRRVRIRVPESSAPGG